ncbi:hypothetical protein [Thioclava sp. GXIMD4216]|uniref:hypothetical protein n=1 Tax=Thioclava sp. GXIMD4216 TaxID=3131929 RepID=UPI0030D4CD6A
MTSRTKITRTRMAGDDHAVISLEGSKGSYRRQQCAGCPWRKDQTGEFPAEAFMPTLRKLCDRTLISGLLYREHRSQKSGTEVMQVHGIRET